MSRQKISSMSKIGLERIARDDKHPLMNEAIRRLAALKKQRLPTEKGANNSAPK